MKQTTAGFPVYYWFCSSYRETVTDSQQADNPDLEICVCLFDV